MNHFPRRTTRHGQFLPSRRTTSHRMGRAITKKRFLYDGVRATQRLAVKHTARFQERAGLGFRLGYARTPTEETAGLCRTRLLAVVRDQAWTSCPPSHCENHPPPAHPGPSPHHSAGNPRFCFGGQVTLGLEHNNLFALVLEGSDSVYVFSLSRGTSEVLFLVFGRPTCMFIARSGSHRMKKPGSI